MRRVSAQWFTGGGRHTICEVSIGSTKIRPPPGSFIPEDVGDIHESLLRRPAPLPADLPVAEGVEEAFELISDSAVAGIPLPPPAGKGKRTVTAHETTWIEDEDAMAANLNGVIPIRSWSIRDRMGEVHCRGSDTGFSRTRLDYFLMMFPNDSLLHITEQTSLQIEDTGVIGTTVEEMIKFFGLIILATRFEFTTRASLWSRIALSRFHAAPLFGRSGMARNRFDVIWAALRFSHQPANRPHNTSSEEYRWMLVSDFVRSFNSHREEYFIPSERICVDESMSRWYGMGGDWINAGLPMYVAIDRKPENGCEIQNSCCATSGVMLRLRIVKSKVAEFEASAATALDHTVNHGTAIIKELVKPWMNSGRVVVADSYFASVQTARELYGIGLRFVGVVKTATKQFPMGALNTVQFVKRGEWKGFYHKREEERLPDLIAFAWVDTNRRYFVSTVSSLLPGNPIQRRRLRQVDRTPDAEPEDVFLQIEQPKIAELYYTSAAKIDQHNRSRQADLGIERKLGTNDWSKRVNLSIFSMIVIDAMFVYKEATLSDESPNLFFHKLAEEMIDYQCTTRAQKATARADVATWGSGDGAHITPTKKRRPSVAGSTPGSSGKKRAIQLAQGRCVCCSMKTTWTCSTCCDDGKNTPVCHTKQRQTCWPMHREQEHE
jgi:hypothetical protein